MFHPAIQFEKLFMAKTKIEQTVQLIQDQIHNKSLLVGSRLPSVRQLATQLNFSI